MAGQTKTRPGTRKVSRAGKKAKATTASRSKAQSGVQAVKDLTIKVCMGTGGLAAGSQDVIDEFAAQLRVCGITADIVKKCVNKTGCRGFCAKDVLVEITLDGETAVYQLVTPDKVSRIVQEHILGGDPVEQWLVGPEYHAFHDKQTKILLKQCGQIDPEDINAYIEIGGYEGVKKALSQTPFEVIEEVKSSGLRGRGGAGFPTGLKWEFCSMSSEAVRYIICNADEGDPGAFMDRAIIEGNPHSVLEGMIIGGYAIGAKEGYIYIRAEYPLAVGRLEIAIEQAKKRGFLGKNVLRSGYDFEIRIKQGAGAFVCGEASALMRSIEGKRGMPRAKLWRSAVKGLWDKPTVLNNVETFANIPLIILNGAEWYRGFGTERSTGTKVFALTGKMKNTGLIEVPMGMTLREMIFDIGGGMTGKNTLKAVQTGGPSGGCIPARHLDLPVDFDSLASVGSMMGSGSMVVVDQTTCMVDLAKFFITFTQHESCGKCVPCRIGTKRMLETLTRITEGRGREDDIDLLIELGNDIKNASLCGLGQSAPNPILSTIEFFREEYEAHIKYGRCPANVCKSLRQYLISPEACKMCGKCSRVCPSGAIKWEPRHTAELDKTKCVKCGACYDACPFNAIM
ncbi:MAG: NADH-quinone oxidoreductase subunit NuoF [Nitrospiraceae bacterium]|nr:MAG: NADH-quinone oxidoreductase subunit NuoF [Nitrospiraceae bacterium]